MQLLKKKKSRQAKAERKRALGVFLDREDICIKQLYKKMKQNKTKTKNENKQKNKNSQTK